MRPVARNLLTVGIAAATLIGGFAGGWYVHTASSTSSAPATLAILAAGSLSAAGLLPALASEFANETPGVAAPISAQLYEGSSAAATALKSTPQPYDIFVAADFRVIPEDLEPPTSTIAPWEVVYASDPLVLAYNTTALHGLNSTNWYTNITAGGIDLGAPNASADPLGVDGIVTIELQDSLASLGGALYHHFYTGSEGALAGPTDALKIVSEDDAATALETGEVQAYLVYRSYAYADHLANVSLSPLVNLGGTSSSDVSGYGSASTTVFSGTGTAVVKGAPILFALTIPSTAPDAVLGVAFAAFLLSNATAARWAADGFVPIAPAWVDNPSDVPAALSGSAPTGFATLPGYLAALIIPPP
jgi:molybdate/tungstate transport system substrate-binding protein